MGLLLGAAVAGCGDDDGGPTDTQVGTGTPRQFAGALGTANAFLAIVGNDTRVNAYVCDGMDTITYAEWFEGDVVDGTFELTSEGGLRLAGAYGDGGASGTLTLPGGSAQSFDIPLSPGAPGLYRGSLEMDGTRYEAGLIAIASGEQRGGVGLQPPPASGSPTVPIPEIDLTNPNANIASINVTIPLREALNAYARR
ncbi:MAG: hypothetical protein IT379_27370 [Deltaproteobacteria bacterium]|nr:hypothetical protein [Deltaproteobacteria bacterium]